MRFVAGIVADVMDQQRPSEPPISQRQVFEPPQKHVAADRAGKALVNLADSIGKAVGLEGEPIVVNRKGRHVSFTSLEDMIDEALEAQSRE